MQPITWKLQEPTSDILSIPPMSPATPRLRTDKSTDVLSSRAKHRNSKSKSVKRSFNLPSGSVLTFSTNPKSETIRDLKIELMYENCCINRCWSSELQKATDCLEWFYEYQTTNAIQPVLTVTHRFRPEREDNCHAPFAQKERLNCHPHYIIIQIKRINNQRISDYRYT